MPSIRIEATTRAITTILRLVRHASREGCNVTLSLALLLSHANRPNQAMQRTAGRSAFTLSMTSTPPRACDARPRPRSLILFSLGAETVAMKLLANFSGRTSSGAVARRANSILQKAQDDGDAHGSRAGERQSTFGFRLLALLPTGCVHCGRSRATLVARPRSHLTMRCSEPPPLRVPTFRDFHLQPAAIRALGGR